MSCCLETPKTFDSIRTSLLADRESYKWLFNRLTKLSDETETEEQIGYFVEQLVNANIAAFRERYQGRYDDETAELENYTPKRGYPVSKIQLYKLLGCVDYQCVDSSAYNEGLGNFTQRVIAAVGDRIITDLPDYDKAQWGFAA